MPPPSSKDASDGVGELSPPKKKGKKGQKAPQKVMKTTPRATKGLSKETMKMKFMQRTSPTAAPKKKTPQKVPKSAEKSGTDPVASDEEEEEALYDGDKDAEGPAQTLRMEFRWTFSRKRPRYSSYLAFISSVSMCFRPNGDDQATSKNISVVTPKPNLKLHALGTELFTLAHF